ncbi:MAG TPA: Ig-like domain-containing protein [Thermoanaerobaculia bacterium]|nr:Ig-like domain-containing protein [Thermoanaerobaculia bacterium]
MSLFVSGSFTALSAKTWTGAVSANWSNPGNWNPQAIPAAGEALLFPNGTPAEMVNDFPNAVVGALTFQGVSPSINGNPLTLIGNITFDATAYSFSCTAPLIIGAPVTMNSAGNNNTYSSIDVNGQTLTVDNVNPVFFANLDGAGTVHANGHGVRILNGAFSGTLTGTWDVAGSVQNANVSATTLTGVGGVGNVVVSYLRPGRSDPGYPDPHAIGLLYTKSLTITTQYGVDLTPGGSDITYANGSVTLTGASLAVSLPVGNPPAGYPITIISNEGSAPVVGTFNGLPEGATVSVDGSVFTISYHGGDGNDVTLTPGVAMKAWVGGNFARWSFPADWSPQAIPVTGEPLVFSIGTSNMTNALPAGFTVGPMTFKGGNVSLTGNALTLTGDVKVEPLVSSFNCGAVKIGNPLTLGAGPNTFYSAIDVNGQTLTVNTYAISAPTTLGSLTGSGTINVTGPGVRIDSDGTFTGAIHGPVELISVSLPNADITAPIMTGIGTAGNVVATTLRPGFGVPADPDLHSSGILHTKSLTIAGGSLDIDLSHNAAGESDLVRVTGTVSLNGALNVSLGSLVPVFGQSFVIIDNDGTDAINGTFTNLPEGAAVHAGNLLFRISYLGGDGNDIELTVAEQPAITVSHAKLSTVIGETATFTASFAAGLPSPLGVLTFAADGVPIGTAPIVSGSATIDVSSLAIGDRVITASFAGGGAFLATVSPPFIHSVRRGGTTTTLQAVDPLAYGASRFRVTAAVSAPAVTSLAGSVTLRENAVIAGTANLDGTTAIVDASLLRPGTHVLIASYDGSTTLTGSESRPLTVSVGPGETHLVVSHQETPSATGNVTLTVAASPVSVLPDIPTGTVTITENGNAIAVEPINGTTNFVLTLTPGVHVLTVTYSGDANFLGDSVEYTVTNGPASPSRHRGVRH